MEKMNKKIKYDEKAQMKYYEETGSFKPVITIKNKNLLAIYYYDGSGEVTLKDRGNYFFHKEDGKLKHQIKYIENEIAEMQKHLGICRQSLKLLKQEQKKHKLL